jgi:multidrug efflux pump subunit AcrA (membrane-fusion protein)
MLMSTVELRSEHARESDARDVPRRSAPERVDIKSRIRLAPILITLGTVVVAALLTWAMWQAYMGAPWTRDGTVRAYVVTMAPEVAGRIVKLPVADNQFVHKGDELFEIDPADYRIALEQAQARAQRDGAALDYARANEGRKGRLAKEGWAIDGHLPANDQHAASIGGDRRLGQGRYRQGAAQSQPDHHSLTG